MIEPGGDRIQTGPENPDARRWDAHYRSREKRPSAARPLLQEYADLLPSSGRALDVAAGLGSNGLFLAGRGLWVVALDISIVAMRATLERARKAGLPLCPVVADLAAMWLPDDWFDVILNFRFLERSLFAKYRRSLKPGGLLFFETFVRRDDDSGAGDFYLEPGELAAQFGDWDVLHRDQIEHTDDEGAIVRQSERLVARKRLRLAP